MAKGGMICIKYVLGIFNFVVLVFGLLLVIYGAKSLRHHKVVHDVVQTPDGSSKAVIAMGSIVIFISFLGCCGAFKENKCMLIIFSFIMLILVVVELILGCAFLSFKKGVREMISDNLTKAMKKYDATKLNATNTIVIDEIQTNLKCCGVDSFNDWKSWNKTIPLSCCPAANVTSAAKDCKEANAWSDGCVKPINKIVKQVYVALGAIAITIAILQFLGISFACCLAYSVHKEYQMV